MKWTILFRERSDPNPPPSGEVCPIAACLAISPAARSRIFTACIHGPNLAVRPVTRLAMKSLFSPALLQTFGPTLHPLPFRLPAKAEAFLGPAERMRLYAFRRLLREAGIADNPALAVVRALEVLFPGDGILLHPGALPPAPRWVLHNWSGQPSCLPIPNASTMCSMRMYKLRGRDPFAGLPVSLGALFESVPAPSDNPETLLHVLWSNGFYHQMRMVLYESQRIALYVGVYRTKGQSPFTLEDHALMLAARVDLLAWYQAAKLVDQRPLGDGALGDIVDSFTEPMVLVVKGRVMHASPRARAFLAPTRIRAKLDEMLRARPVKVLRVNSQNTQLVRLEEPEDHATSALSLNLRSLPPALWAIATDVAKGMSDKEIAERRGHSLTTIRTYVSRIYDRLGVHSRRELARRYGVRGTSEPTE